MKKIFALNFSYDVFIMLIDVKMPTIGGILTFMSRINLCSAEFSMIKSFITVGPDTLANGEDLDYRALGNAKSGVFLRQLLILYAYFSCWGF